MTKFEKILKELKDWLGEQWEDGELDALIYNIIDICGNDDTETNSLYQTKEVKYDYDEFEDGETVEQVIIDNKKYIDIEYFAKIKARNNIKKQIQAEIENNGYYENIRAEYLKSEDKQHYIENIYNIYFGWYNAEFSIYKVMDTIEDYMKENGDSFDSVVDYQEFELKD